MANALQTRKAVNPIDVPKTIRVDTTRGITSLPAGRMVPIYSVGLHRMDSILNTTVRISFELNETVEVLLNAVKASVKAYFVPMLAMDRFQGSMDVLNRAYEGQAALDGQPVIPYIENIVGPAYKTNDILVYLGKHYKVGAQLNTAEIEAYNQIWNYRAANRSKSITPRTRLQSNLAPAFWDHEMFKHIVPDFDSAKADGEIPLTVVNSSMPVKGIGFSPALSGAGDGGAGLIRESDGTTRAYPNGVFSTRATGIIVKSTTGVAGTAFPQITAELAANGITISLANIELAKKTQAFAKLREQFAGHTDDWLINLLMDGIVIPDQQLKDPVLVAEADTIFGFSKRHATDGANLTDAVVDGATFVDLNIRLPQALGVTGGVLMIVAEVFPEQLFERQKDPFLHMTNAEADRPKFLRDYMDPFKVETVYNDMIDVNHGAPTGVFGYAPMGHKWNSQRPHIGGKFYRPEANAAFDEDRQRIWAAEPINPTLGPDFYLCTTIHTKPFAVTNNDIAECMMQGDILIQGSTQFGPALIEASNDYAKVLAEVDQSRIVKP